MRLLRTWKVLKKHSLRTNKYSIRLFWQLEHLETVAKAAEGFAVVWTQAYFSKSTGQSSSRMEPLVLGVRVETSLFLYTHY